MTPQRWIDNRSPEGLPLALVGGALDAELVRTFIKAPALELLLGGAQRRLTHSLLPSSRQFLLARPRWFPLWAFETRLRVSQAGGNNVHRVTAAFLNELLRIISMRKTSDKSPLFHDEPLERFVHPASP